MSKKEIRNGLGELYEKHTTVIDTFTKRTRDEKEYKDVYYCLRENRITFYYKGRELLTLLNDNDQLKIKLRNLSAPSQNSQRKEELEKINAKYIEDVNSIEYKRIKPEFILKNNKKEFQPLDITNYSTKKLSYKSLSQKLFDAGKTFLDSYYKGKEDLELPTQGKYCAKYKELLNDFIVIDMEYVEPQDESNETEENEKMAIGGRYDMLALQKMKNNKYKLIFIELKCNKSAIVNEKTGVIQHIEDMSAYVKNGLSDEFKNMVTNVVEKRKEYGRRGSKSDSDIIDIDFTNPEIWILFDMQQKEKQVQTEEEIKKLLPKLQTSNAKFFWGDIEHNKKIEEIKGEQI
ncbi:MAG: hypothetical protein LBN74_02060 [Prevotella sp.]|jgi:hypothetical protein|nr:hypothetical protein [Prevotella sp.]